MLSDSLTLTGVFVNEDTGADTAESDVVYARLGDTINRSQYNVQTTFASGSVHDDVSRNILQFYRTYAKRSGSSRGATKVAAKFTEDISVANADGSGDIVLPLIGELSMSIPVGATHAEISNLRRKMAYLLLDSADSTTEPTSALQLLSEGSHHI